MTPAVICVCLASVALAVFTFGCALVVQATWTELGYALAWGAGAGLLPVGVALQGAWFPVIASWFKNRRKL